MYVSRNVNDNLYIYVSINEKMMLKDKAESHKLFTDQELNEIYAKVVTKKILLQDSDKRTYNIENLAEVSVVNLFENQEFTTYLIVLNSKLIEFPAKILFNYSFKFRYYRFLDDKIKNQNIQNVKPNTYRRIVDYDESLVNYNYSELIRDTETIITDDIDYRKYNSIKERVTFSTSETISKSLLDQYTLQEDNFLPFSSMIIDGQVVNITSLSDAEAIEYYGKLINNVSDYDYKRFLNLSSIFINVPENPIPYTVPQGNKENTVNTNIFSEEGLFKKENIKVKTDESKDSENLFLAFVLKDGQVEKPVTEEEVIDYNNFLFNSFTYPKYFFKHVLKFKLEYLQTIDNISMQESWAEINSSNIEFVSGLEKIFCRISLKNKKYFDKVAYEYFLLEA